ncbi:kinesin-like protein KIN-10C isoform X1 [Beta vulgaris subsp. vulgaris]|uniref:kinesin-like protein KIN-10C isoform X1 n=1 Tax=Beta vulgaris subsp. vulgaris TaxID=3555 RepID=UPI002036BF58|nr:kinesin-like protein KIN-10C isoform X1 [Beta vulgaris subsp. vulgaris]
MGSNPGGKVRIVARIRGHSNKDIGIFDGVTNSKPWISVLRPDPVLNPNSRSSRVKISFGSDQTSSSKQSYELDECYDRNVGTEAIFAQEIKPLISGVFGGENSTIFAYGPRGSGKTYTIQGCEEELGLAVRTVDEILPQAEEQGKFVTVSVFELYQDRVSDLLDAKRPEVSVFEDAQGKIRLKGLSKVKVNSTPEFQDLYLQAANARKQLQKAIEPPTRSHIGCIVHIVSPQTEKSNTQLVGKINFIDLASYEDSRRKSSDGSNLTEATRINKSLYAVHNVLYALNAKEARVPYRESKLTRMLQDSLGGMSRILMVTCLNPSLCQETVQTASLASRSCMAGFLACLDPGKSSRSATKTVRMSSPQVLKSASKFNIRSSMMSPKLVKPMSASASGKKQAGSQLHIPRRKTNDVPVEAKGRKLFDDANQSKKSEQRKLIPESASVMESSSQTEVSLTQASEAASISLTCPENASVMESSSQTELSLVLASEAASNSSTQQEGKSALNDSEDMDSSRLPSEEDVLPIENSFGPVTPFTHQTPLTEDKENKSSFLNGGASPPLSARIRELSNNLKSLCMTTETNLKITRESSNLLDQVIYENLEPATPILYQHISDDEKHENIEFNTPRVESNVRANEKYEIANLASPWGSLHMRSAGMKDSLVHECLKFLNSASKEELKGLKGIGEKRATYILEMREESPEPFKQLDDLKDIGLSAKQIKGMMKTVAGDLLF